MASLNLNFRRISGSRIWAAIPILFFVAVISFCSFYILSAYDYLVKWYASLNDCFYKRGYWTNDFFTPHTKAAGNVFCIIALLFSVPGIFFALKRFKKSKEQQAGDIVVNIDPHQLSFTGMCLVVITLFWFWGKSLVAPSNDEVFSAVNCAGIHPFQTLSYYMLPNNHVLFNLVNNILFHPFSDKLVTGKIISLACYWGIISISFFWLKALFHNKWLALPAALTLALQFPVWAFGFQARGYEILALASWISFACLFRYFISLHEKWLLYLSVTACCLGYFCIPSFLYFHAGLVAFATLCQLINKKADILFWKCQVVCIVFVFLLYLPAICFSGSSALTGNEAVTQTKTYNELLADAIPVFQDFMEYCFANFVTKNYLVDFLLFLMPLCLLFYRKNKIAFFLGVFYLALWGSMILLILKMRLFPIDRTLPGHFSITLALVIYTAYLLISSLAQKVSIKPLPHIIMPLFLVTLSIHFAQKDKVNVGHYICHFPVNDYYDGIMKDGMVLIPKGSSVSFSSTAFYCYYLCKKKGCRVSSCMAGSEDYFIKFDWDELPPGIKENYVLIKQGVMGYNFYKRK